LFSSANFSKTVVLSIGSAGTPGIGSTVSGLGRE